MSDAKYNELLSKAHLMMPSKEEEKQRLEIPSPDSFIQGNKTIVKNFGQILKVINREEKHFMKFLSKETASAVTSAEGKITFNSKINALQISRLFDAYMKLFVFCPECGKPDTKFAEHGGVKIIKCDACGAVFPRHKV